METNTQIELAYEFVQNTNMHVFLTGKAGTGKTTFLHRIKKEINKRMAVVAPTGVAAINAKGVTIHSLFQLPFGPIVPNQNSSVQAYKFNKRKINLLKSLDLLVIDEISMVRADVLDGIDGVLRKYKDRNRPFGGVQLLMIGDLNQLAPVVRQQEWDLLRNYYQTEYFFGSLALQKSHFVCIELEHIYRQSNPTFIALLNKVRNNEIDHEVLEQLNSRFQPEFEPKEEEGYVTLTSHNRTADAINKDKLKLLSTKSYAYEADVDGTFPENAFPNALSLNFKLGAQVMFIKNDLSEEKRFYNGKIGRIIDLDKTSITVLCEGDTDEIKVEPLVWENTKYTLNEKTKEVEEEIIGSFKQMPLKLAWAITIHKSQGLTFEKVVIDAQDAFAHGQVYVALSRCKTFEGIVLRTKIQDSSVKTDAVISTFNKDSQNNQPGVEELKRAKHLFQQELLLSLFTMQNLNYAIINLDRAAKENDKSLHGNIVKEISDIHLGLEQQVFAFGKKFIPVLHQYFQSEELPESNKELVERLKKAGAYFVKTIENDSLKGLLSIEVLTDNHEVEKTLEERLKNVKIELRKSLVGFKNCAQGYQTQKVIRSMTDIELDDKDKKTVEGKKFVIPTNIPNKKLYEKLVKWRNAIAEAEDFQAYKVLTTRSMIELCEVLPSSGKTLKKIHGVGKVKLDKYGEEILEIITNYTESNDLETDQIAFTTKKEKVKKEAKTPTAEISFKLYQSGKTPEEIAKERGFVKSTILGHLARYIKTGEIEVTELVDEKIYREISGYFLEKKVFGLNEAREFFGDKYDFGVLRLVRDSLVGGEEL